VTISSSQLQVKLFAKASDLAGGSSVSIPWTNGQTVRILRQKLFESRPALGPLASRLLIAVNNEYARDDSTITMTDEVACFPPVSGG